jgi:hypothetical protein
VVWRFCTVESLTISDERSRAEGDFNGILLRSIDSTLVTILGEHVAAAIHVCLIKRYATFTDDLTSHLDTFLEVLVDLLGVSSATAIGKVIAREFYSKLGLEFLDVPNHDLQDYVEEAGNQGSRSGYERFA